MSTYTFVLNKASKDKRVAALARICKSKGIATADINDEFDRRKAILFVEPRAKAPADSSEYKYVFDYARLSMDEDFIRDNNYLTALALKKIFLKEYGTTKKKVLIMGWGKLTSQLERVFTDTDIHILNFNKYKVQELMPKYGDKAYFETAPLKDFDIVINTIPKNIVNSGDFKKGTTVFELASAPYGVSGDTSVIDYRILPGLPGVYSPTKAATIAFDAIERFLKIQESKPTIVLCINASSCCYLKLLPVLEELTKYYKLIPVLSQNANLPNRFVDIEYFRKDIIRITGNAIITTIAGAEVLSSKKEIAASLVLPATGNTIAKLTNAVTDTPVTMAVKALLRNSKPCIIGISTNDALSGNASNIGTLLNRKCYYFIPYGQDDYVNKPFSMVCDFSRAKDTIDAALLGKQIQPIVIA
ncbi:MAG: dipicolinate synthase subunit B [Firmicutes bacterium]|nr:dipicolinate synthase subunit B [Bacillota bacterium]